MAIFKQPVLFPEKGTRIYWDWERNVGIGIFRNKNKNGTPYTIFSISCNNFKNRHKLNLSVQEFQRLVLLVNRIKLEGKKNVSSVEKK